MMSSYDDSDTDEEVICRILMESCITSEKSARPLTSFGGPSTSSGGLSTSSRGELIGNEKDIKAVPKTGSWRKQQTKSKKNSKNKKDKKKKKKAKMRNNSRYNENADPIVEAKTDSSPPPCLEENAAKEDALKKVFGEKKGIISDMYVKMINSSAIVTENPHDGEMMKKLMEESLLFHIRYYRMDVIFSVLVVSKLMNGN